jgi:uncharacterized OsmC-like protein
MSESVLERQEPLRKRYRDAPREAWITDGARTLHDAAHDPFHAAVVAGEGDERWPIGIHRAVGGFHDLPNPGDVLCAALAGCLDTTLRILAERMRVPLEDVGVQVTGEIDVRGTLAVDAAVPVGMQHMTCRLRVAPGAHVHPEAIARLAAAAERACVVLQTLRQGVRVDLEVRDERSGERRETTAAAAAGERVSR